MNKTICCIIVAGGLGILPGLHLQSHGMEEVDYAKVEDQGLGEKLEPLENKGSNSSSDSLSEADLDKLFKSYRYTHLIYEEERGLFFRFRLKESDSYSEQDFNVGRIDFADCVYDEDKKHFIFVSDENYLKLPEKNDAEKIENMIQLGVGPIEAQARVNAQAKYDAQRLPHEEVQVKLITLNPESKSEWLGKGGRPKTAPVLGKRVKVYDENLEIKIDGDGRPYTGLSIQELQEAEKDHPDNLTCSSLVYDEVADLFFFKLTPTSVTQVQNNPK